MSGLNYFTIIINTNHLTERIIHMTQQHKTNQHESVDPSDSLTTDYIGIDDNRLRHMREVGLVSAEIATDIFGWSIQRCRQMFLLGFIHDVGYQFSIDQTEHEEIGGHLLKEAGFKYASAVSEHGDPDVKHMSTELLILNIADMSVNRTGNRVSFSERLEDILNRYGQDSVQYRKAKSLVSAIAIEMKKLDLELPSSFT